MTPRLALLALFAFPGAALAIVTAPSPGFPLIDPQYVNDHCFVKLQYSIANSIYPGTGNSTAGSDTYAAEEGDINTIPITSLQAAGDLGAAFNNNQTIAGADLFASIGNGVGKIYTHAYAHAGIALGQASVTLSAIDKMTIQTDGQPLLNALITGTPTRTYIDQQDYANSSGSVDLYIWPTYKGVPAAGTFFNPAYWSHYAITSDGITQSEQTDTSQSFTAGTTWYVGEVISATSNAYLGNGPYWLAPSYPDISSTADFSHSFHLQITADPSTPNFSYSMASGIDYTQPLPEPGVLLVAPALLLLTTRNRCHAR